MPEKMELFLIYCYHYINPWDWKPTMHFDRTSMVHSTPLGVLVGLNYVEIQRREPPNIWAAMFFWHSVCIFCVCGGTWAWTRMAWPKSSSCDVASGSGQKSLQGGYGRTLWDLDPSCWCHFVHLNYLEFQDSNRCQKNSLLIFVRF